MSLDQIMLTPGFDAAYAAVGTKASFRVDFSETAQDYSVALFNGTKTGLITTRLALPVRILEFTAPAGFSVTAGGLDDDTITFTADTTGAQDEFELVDNIPQFSTLTTISLGS